MVETYWNPALAKFSNQGSLSTFGVVFGDIHTQTTPWESFTSYALTQADRWSIS